MVRRRRAEEQAGCAGAYLEGEGCRAGRGQLPCTGLGLAFLGVVESHETIRTPQLTPDSPPLFLCFWGDCPGDQRNAEGATAALVALPPWPVGVSTACEE